MPPYVPVHDWRSIRQPGNALCRRGSVKRRQAIVLEGAALRSRLDNAWSASFGFVNYRGFIMPRRAGGFFLPASESRGFILPRIAKLSWCPLHHIQVKVEESSMQERFTNTRKEYKHGKQDLKGVK